MAIYQLANLTSSNNTFTGTNKFNTSSGDNPLCISRNTSTSEITSIYQNDTGVFFDILNDEATTHITFKLKATDTESGDGANASEGSVAIALGAGNKTSVTASSFTGSLSGNATTATSLGSAVDVGGTTTPVYFLDGKPKALSYKIESSVPSNAKFTDTTYKAATTSAAGLMSATDKSKLDNLNTNFYTKSEIDALLAKYLLLAGGTIEGDLIVNGTINATEEITAPTFDTTT